MLFRQMAAQYSRKDSFADGERGWRQRWKLMRAAYRFLKGTGLTPVLHEEFSAVPFADLDSTRGRWPAGVDELFTRYFRVKLQGLHFCGRGYFNVPIAEGFQSLVLMLPVVLWLARWLALSAERMELQTADVARALAIADHHHGYDPIFEHSGSRGRVRWLAKTGEIGSLVAWYSR
jgi:lysine-N-methylase